MKLAQDDKLCSYLIKRYEPNTITINGSDYNKSLIVHVDAAPENWHITDFVTFTAEHLSSLTATTPELILIGTGVKHVFPSKAQLKLLCELPCGYEVMNNYAACRSFNLMANDGRKVVLGLIL